jgi:hypothetical protein
VKRSTAVALTGALLALGACAERGPQGPAEGGDPGPQRYQADATVLESPDHGPELCLGGIADSLPPQCSGVPIANWDWDLVEGEESASGTTWGEFHLVGNFDGTSFTVLETGDYRPPESPAMDFTPPCPEPAGGWVATDPSRTSEDDRIAAMLAAEAEQDSAGFWIDYTVEPSEGELGPDAIVVIATFTGDLERHEADLRELWGGPLCVARQDRSSADLRRIRSELETEVGPALGLQMTWSATDVVRNRVEMGVVVAAPEVVAELTERYGDAVVLWPALMPVEA